MTNSERYINHFIYNIHDWMKAIAIKMAKVVATSDNKKLRSGKNATYEYGTISIRDKRLTSYIGKKVRVRVEPAEDTKKG